MARLVPGPSGGGPVGAFEQQLVQRLKKDLPDTFTIVPNFLLRERDGQSYEYDVVVLAPHALFVIEAKEWYGRLTGDDTEWLLNEHPKKCPMWLTEKKAKVLKSKLGAFGTKIWVEALVALPDGIQNYLQGNWAPNVQSATGIVRFLLEPKRIRFAKDIRGSLQAIEKQLTGEAGRRLRGQPTRVGTYQVLETLYADDDVIELKAKRALLDDPNLYRVRTWRLSGYESAPEREERLNRIRRPTEAIAKVGRHPNLLPILEFSFLPDENLFYEVTEWSEFGTLHGFLRNHARDQLTLRERLEIVAGVTSALEAVHMQGLVHRNVCPETILVAFDRTPRLTDFDRAYIESKKTVFPGTEKRSRNAAYVAPELRTATDYDFDSCSDMFSLGVLLYELLVGAVPFPDVEKPIPKTLPKRPSEVRDGVDTKLDDLVAQLLLADDFRARPTASQTLSVLRDVLGSSHGPRKASSSSARNGKGQVFEVGHVVDGVYRIDARLGSGSFSQVWKVYHLDQARTFAMKVLSRPEDADVMLDEFNKIGALLPQHPHIARIAWLGRTAPPASVPYILSEYVDGEPLDAYCDGRKTLPWTDIRRIGLELLAALQAIHPRPDDLMALQQLRECPQESLSETERLRLEHLQLRENTSILHRDIKPANILLELPNHRAKLIDFNIATTQADAAGRGGTPRYWAPDRGRPSWQPNMDLFSLGVVIFELVTHRHPFKDDNPESGAPYDPRAIAPDLHLSDELAAFLLKAVEPAGNDRFQSAEEMSRALAGVATMRGVAPASGEVTRSLGLTLDAGESGRRNYNPFVTRLLTLYSQATRTNAGTRGLDEIARLTYVDTKLDRSLAPLVADGQLRLLIVTGNAGDGKTAFLQQVEDHFARQDVSITRLPSGNGSTWTRDGLSFETNYDGSQDEGAEQNDDVLARFLSSFEGTEVGGLTGQAVRLLAINEGRLLDFLVHSRHAARFKGLRALVQDVMTGDKVPPAAALLVNLNLRAVAAGGRESIFEKQLLAMLREGLWVPCDSCEYVAKCPLKHNADTMSDPASGPMVRDRLRRLFEVIHLRRRAHVTMRDLRSALAWILLRDTSCHDVGLLLRRDDDAARRELADLYYPDALATVAKKPRDRVDDRLVRLLREADVGSVNAPKLDGALDRSPDTALPWMTFEKRSDFARQVVGQLSIDGRSQSEVLPLDGALRERRQRIARWRRWAYFERRDEGWLNMLPYRSVPLVEQAISTDPAEREAAALALRSEVLEAVSLSEGMRHPDIRRRFLALRVSRVKAPTVRTYRLFPQEVFSVHIPTGGALGSLIEYAPDAVEIRSDTTLGHAHLRLSLDLLEMLSLIRGGYRPSPQDLQGLFVNLQMFRNELLSLPFDRVIATQDDEKLFEIASSITQEGAIELSLREYGDHGDGEATL